MITPERIDSLKNQYPHLSDQNIVDMLSRSKEENLKQMYPQLSIEEIEAYLKDKPDPESLKKKSSKVSSSGTGKSTKKVATAEQIAKRKAAAEKGKATKAANLAKKQSQDPNQ